MIALRYMVLETRKSTSGYCSGLDFLFNYWCRLGHESETTMKVFFFTYTWCDEVKNYKVVGFKNIFMCAKKRKVIYVCPQNMCWPLCYY